MLIQLLTMSLSKPLYPYEKPLYTVLYKKDISDTLVVQVKRQDETGKKFFDLRKKNAKTGVFGVSGIFLLKDEFPTLEEALRNVPSTGSSKSFAFVTGRTLELVATGEHVTLSASREKSHRQPASINVGYDELSMINLSLDDVRKFLL